MWKYAVAVPVFIGLTLPAAAAEYYVVRDPSTKECTVVEEKPAGTEVRVLGNKVFTTREEAQSQVSVVCTKETEPSGGAVVIEKN